MKTDDLIVLLSRQGRVRIGFGEIMAGAGALAVAASTILFFTMMGVRADFMAAIDTARFLFKLAVTITLTLVAGGVLSWIGRPGLAWAQRRSLLLIPLVMLFIAVAVEMVAMPPTSWYPLMIGHDALACLIYIPLLSIVPLALFLVALRRGAPENAGAAGAIAGLTAAGIGSILFAIYCDNDSPFFVALWYPSTFAVTTAAGYLAGRQWLYW